jgi:hypothetical protein
MRRQGTAREALTEPTQSTLSIRSLAKVLLRNERQPYIRRT